MIPANKMIALWADGPEMKIERFTICHINQQTDETADIENSAGACNGDWLAGDDPLATPLGLFAQLVACQGFPGQEDMFAALREFAKVENQDWAVKLLKRAGAPDTG
jgi:hypothetical protein